MIPLTPPLTSGCLAGNSGTSAAARPPDKAFAGLRGLPELTYLNVSYCPTLTHEAMAAAFGTPRGPLVVRLPTWVAGGRA